MATKTLIIGGGGYIGSHLAVALIAAGRNVTVLGRGAVSPNALPKEAIYISGNFSDLNVIRPLLEVHSEVIHLAYASTPNTSVDNALNDLRENLYPSVQLFAEVAKSGGVLILVSSGGTVYGESVSLPISEGHPTMPISPYGVTKLTLENYAYLYSMTHDLKYICVRPSNAYGPGQRPFMGQGFIATALASAMKGQLVSIFGKTGTVRDYIYISDLVHGIVCALIHGRRSETYNIGSGTGLTNLEIINTARPLLEEIGYSVFLKFLPERTLDVRVNILDSSKLQIHTGWKPCVSIETGLQLTRDWVKACYG